MDDHLSRILTRARYTLSAMAMSGKVNQEEALLYAAYDEIRELERENERVSSEAKTLREKIKELEQRNTTRTKLNLFRNIKFLNINKLIDNEKD